MNANETLFSPGMTKKKGKKIYIYMIYMYSIILKIQTLALKAESLQFHFFFARDRTSFASISKQTCMFMLF